MGFFNRTSSSQPPPMPPQAERGAPLMSAVLIGADTFPFTGYMKLLETTPGAGYTAEGVELTDGSILTFNLGDDLAALALMPAPYPASDLDGPIQTSWMWPD